MDLSQLRGAGLSESEAAIYVGLLKLGPTLVSRLSELTGFHRTNIYDTLGKLKDKGLATQHLENGKKHFSAADPQRLLAYLDERKETVERVLPELNRLREEALPKSEVQIMKGNDVLQRFRKEVADDIMIFGSGFGIKGRMLAAEQADGARIFPYLDPTPTAVYDDITAMLIKNPLMIIKIRNAELAEEYRRHFETLWKTARVIK